MRRARPHREESPLPPSRAPRSALGRLLRDRRGATMVEFSLIALPLLVLIFGILESGFDIFAANALELATQNAARQLMTGSNQNTATASDFETNALCPQLPFFMDCAKVVVSAHTVDPGMPLPYTAVAGAGGTIAPVSLSQASASWCIGGPGDREYLTVAYPLPVLTQIWDAQITRMPDGSSARLLVSRAVWMNEPGAAVGNVCS